NMGEEAKFPWFQRGGDKGDGTLLKCDQRRYRNLKPQRKLGGAFTSVQMWSPPCVPTPTEHSEGWYQPSAPSGQNSSFHRSVWSYTFPRPLWPISDHYVTPGGLQQ